MHGVATLCNCSVVLIASSQDLFTHTSSRVLPRHKTKRLFSREISPNRVAFELLQQRLWGTSWCSTIERDGPTHHVRNFLWSTCPQVGFWCQHILFGFLVQIDPVKQPIKRDSVGPGHASHSRTSVFDNNFDHRFIVFKDVQLSFELTRFCVCGQQLSFPHEASKWVSVQISFKMNHWISNVWPRCWPFVSWKTYPFFWKLWHQNFEQFLSVLQSDFGCKQILRRLLVHHGRVALQWHPLLLRPSFEMQTKLALWIRHKSQSRLLQCHLGVATRPLYFWYFWF